MKRFIPSAPSLGLASLMAVVALGVSSAAQAALVSADFKKPGDGLLTRDTRTGLEWLDLSQTSGLSYAAVASEFAPKYRFQLATPAQVEGLFQSARQEPTPFPATASVSGDAIGVYWIQTLIGYQPCSITELSPYLTQKICQGQANFGKLDNNGMVLRTYYFYNELSRPPGPNSPTRASVVLSASGQFGTPTLFTPSPSPEFPTFLVRSYNTCPNDGTKRPCPVNDSPTSVWTNIP
jgi:hypothetical protein